MTAHAQWKYSGSSDNSDSYIDYSRIKIEGQYKSVWALENFVKPQTNHLGNEYKSEASKLIIDCQSSRLQIVAFYDYSEQMSNGVMVGSYDSKFQESRWYKPNSIEQEHIKIACAINSNPKPLVNNIQDIKRQKCIRLGLAPGSVDFQQCMH
jgi:hypothetical protein